MRSFRIRVSPVLLLGSALAALSIGASAAEDVGTTGSSQPTARVREEPSIGPATPEDVTDELEESRMRADSIFGPGPLEPVHRAWDAMADAVEEGIGLKLGMNYTLVYQYGTRAREEPHAAAGDLDLFGSWHVFDLDGRWPGRIVFDTEVRHRAAPITPNELAEQVGSAWPTTVEFDEQDFSVVQVYWDQGSFEDRFRYRLGKQDPSLVFHGGRYTNSSTAYLNAAFSDTPTLPFPEAGFGVTAGVYPSQEVYVLAAVQDALGDREGFSFDDRGLFSALELGFTPGYGERGEGLYNLTFWHTEEREEEGERLPAAWGFALALEKELGEKGNVVPFVRYSWASDAATPVQQLLAVGVGFEEVCGRNRDLIGLGVSWGRPHDRSRPDQYVAEAFYRLHLTRNVNLTPDIQLIVNPSDAPSRRTVWVFGVRLRTLF